jgi:hypothetical protein
VAGGAPLDFGRSGGGVTAMPTLPLLTSPTHVDGWHRVAAPGGYETWHFDAESADRRVRLLVALHQGDPMRPAYLRRYARYRAAPTRFHPPLPREYPAVAVELFEDDRVTCRVVEHAAPHDFAASDDGSKIRIAASHVERDAATGVRHLRARVHARGRTVAIHLLFRPVVRVRRSVELSPHHAWLLSDPLCTVDGEVQLLDDSGAAPRIVVLNGRGYHDHRVGTRSLGELARSVFSGRILLDGSLVAMHQAAGERLKLVDVTRAGAVVENEIGLYAEGSARTDWGLRYPLDLPSPRVIDSTFAAATIVYDAMGRDHKGTAMCQVVAPPRAGWRIG